MGTEHLVEGSPSDGDGEFATMDAQEAVQEATPSRLGRKIARGRKDDVQQRFHETLNHGKIWFGLGIYEGFDEGYIGQCSCRSVYNGPRALLYLPRICQSIDQCCETFWFLCKQ